MTKNSIAFLFAFFLLFSCRKEEIPQPASGSPLFYFKGAINNQSVNLNGGVSDYYLFTTYSLTTDGINLLNGTLKDETCTSNCTNALSISIGDYKKRNGSPINDIQMVLKNGSYSFYVNDSATFDTSKVYQFSADSGYPSYKWDFGDGTISTLQNPTHIYSQQNAYNVCLTVDNGNGCTKTMCNQVISGEATAEDLTFSYSLSQNTITLNGPPGWDSYLWALSDTDILYSGKNITHTYKQNGLYDICLTATKSNQAKTFCREIKVPGTYDCTADWSYSTSTVIQPITDSVFSKVIIEWTDAGGKKYNSSLQKQPAASYFTIKSGNNYINNANNQKTYQFRCNFDLMLYDETNPSTGIHINSNDCNWGVAYL